MDSPSGARAAAPSRRMLRPSHLLAALLVAAACRSGQDVEPALKDMPFVELGAQDLADHPKLGMKVGNRHLLVFFREDAADADIRAALAGAGVELAGVRAALRMAFVRLTGEPAWDRLEAARLALAAHPAVEVVAYDPVLEATMIPPPRGGNVAHPSSNWTADGGWNWGLKAIGAPQAWNLVPFLRSFEGSSPRRVAVGVIDTGFNAHPDLAGVQVLRHRSGEDSAESAAFNREFGHGTFMAGEIGALWNGQHTDGVVPQPHVRIYGVFKPDSSDVATPQRPQTFGEQMVDTIELLAGADAGLRVVNMSIGFNWSVQCLPEGGRCDPRPTGRVPDAKCDDLDTRIAISDAGRAFKAYTARLNADRKVLFLASAGNDAAPPNTTIPACGQPQATMGEFPAMYSSPMASAGLLHDDPNTLVVGAIDPTGSTRARVNLWIQSNVGSHVLAPGNQIGGLTRTGGSYTTIAQAGTSQAVPFVAGAAAYLALLDPDISNAELRRLLTLNVVDVANNRTNTTAPAPVLHLGRAVAEMRVKLPSGARVPGERLMADLDDGSEDGFERRATELPIKRFEPARIDLADVRALRDATLLMRDPTASIDCPAGVPACDLNRDGAVRPRPELEPYPLAALTGRDIDDGTLALIQRYYDGDARQPYVAADLPALMRSADLHVEAQAFLGRARIEGVASATIELAGATLGGGSVTAAALTLPLREAPMLLTTPKLVDASIVVTAGARTFTAPLGTLRIAEDRLLRLNPCVWDDPQAPLIGAGGANCTDDQDDARGLDIGASPFRPDIDAGLDGARPFPPRAPGDIDAGTHGDPHFETWDGLYYDFQGAGEFVLVRDAAREVQVRQAPVAGSRSVAVNTAVALRAGADRVELRRGERGRVWLNGQPTELGAGLALADADLTRGPGSILIQWKDGDQLGAVIHDDALDLYAVFKPRPGRALSGLLGGPPNGDPDDDLVARGGAVFREPSARDLHRVYGDSWRVSAAESLFTYAAGERPETFVDPLFPVHLASLADLDPAVQAAAHARCVAAGVRQPALLEACVLDVASMGRDSAAWSFRGVSDPKATWSPATFRADFEAGPSPSITAPDLATLLAPPRTRTRGAEGSPPTWFYGPLAQAPEVARSVTLNLGGLGEHDAVALSFDIHALGEWRGNADGAARVEVLDNLLRPVVRTTYATGDARQAYPGSSPGGDFPAGTGAIARDVLGRPGGDAVYRHRVVFPHLTDMLILAFYVHGGAGERWGLDNVEVTTLRDPARTIERVDPGGGDLFPLVHGPAGDPATLGCADGTREAFLDLARAPSIAGCTAAWPAQRSLAAPATGAGDQPADACAAGWHVCRADDLRAVEPLACLNAGAGQFLAAASMCPAEGACGPADACLSEGPCSGAVCCGTMCRPSATCDDGVWPDLTWSVDAACGALTAHPLRGVLCCRG